MTSVTIRMVGGTLDIQTATEYGTVVFLEVPHSRRRGVHQDGLFPTRTVPKL